MEIIKYMWVIFVVAGVLGVVHGLSSAFGPSKQRAITPPASKVTPPLATDGESDNHPLWDEAYNGIDGLNLDMSKLGMFSPPFMKDD